MNEKIIKYFAGQMSLPEIKNFEQQIDSSPELKKEVEKCRKFFDDLSSAQNLPVDENYFINMVPQFRTKLQGYRQKRYHPKFAFAAALLTVIIIMFYAIPDRETRNDGNILNNFSTSDITDYLSTNNDQTFVTNLPADVQSNYDSVLDGMIYSELNSNDKDLAAASLYDKLDYNTIIKSIDQNEAAIIYKKLKNKNFF